DAVLTAVSSVLGVPAGSVAPDRPLADLGLDSLMAVELRNQLAALSGLRLPATLLFDHPTPHALSRFLETGIAGDRVAGRQLHTKAAASEPIAIVAMSCRYPSGVESPEALWELLLEGRDGTSEFPSERGWSAEDLYDPDPEAVGKSTVTRGGFLH